MKIKTLFRNSGVFQKSNGSNGLANVEANGGEANVIEEKNTEQISENSSGIGLETCSLSELIETDEHSELNGTDSGGTSNSSSEQEPKFISSKQNEHVSSSEHFGSPNVLELDRDFDQLSWSEFKIDFVSFRIFDSKFPGQIFSGSSWFGPFVISGLAFVLGTKLAIFSTNFRFGLSAWFKSGKGWLSDNDFGRFRF